jgi:hypothetical protein
MTSARRVSAGTTWCQYTSSVVEVWLGRACGVPEVCVSDELQ